MRRHEALAKLAEFTAYGDRDRVISYGGFDFEPAELYAVLAREAEGLRIPAMF